MLILHPVRMRELKSKAPAVQPEVARAVKARQSSCRREANTAISRMLGLYTLEEIKAAFSYELK